MLLTSNIEWEKADTHWGPEDGAQGPFVVFLFFFLGGRGCCGAGEHTVPG